MLRSKKTFWSNYSHSGVLFVTPVSKRLIISKQSDNYHSSGVPGTRTFFNPLGDPKEGRGPGGRLLTSNPNGKNLKTLARYLAGKKNIRETAPAGAVPRYGQLVDPTSRVPTSRPPLGPKGFLLVPPSPPDWMFSRKEPGLLPQVLGNLGCGIRI